MSLIVYLVHKGPSTFISVALMYGAIASILIAMRNTDGTDIVIVMWIFYSRFTYVDSAYACWLLPVPRAKHEVQGLYNTRALYTRFCYYIIYMICCTCYIKPQLLSVVPNLTKSQWLFGLKKNSFHY